HRLVAEGAARSVVAAEDVPLWDARFLLQERQRVIDRKVGPLGLADNEQGAPYLVLGEQRCHLHLASKVSEPAAPLPDPGLEFADQAAVVLLRRPKLPHPALRLLVQIAHG